VAHLLSQACLLNSCHGVTATDDGGGALGGQLSQGLGNGLVLQNMLHDNADKQGQTQ
jgi:hypothetical protein